MLKTQEILERFNLIDREQYKEMLGMVHIPDFYKCIAQFSGLKITEVSDDAIVDYLTKWCKNKYRFFKMLGNKTRLDLPFEYVRMIENLRDEFKILSKDYPAYYHWFKHFQDCTKNKIDTNRVHWQIRDAMDDLFPGYNLSGTTLTHFFKNQLKAPDDLVTKIGRLFENDAIKATYTISIDPVDMMLASENPYDWTSCYRLELDRDDSHADGCLASVIDTKTLITYVWEAEGKYDLYGVHKFKSVRYYRMRGWIAISDDFGAVCFCGVYPGRSSYDEAFKKQLREVVEKVVADYKEVPNVWRKNDMIEYSDATWKSATFPIRINRSNYYGYNEFDSEYLFLNNAIIPKVDTNKMYKPEEIDRMKRHINTYDEKIVCPCGCGMELMGSDEVAGADDYEEGWCYNGEGFKCDSFYENEPEYKWCPYRDDYCTCHCMEYDDCDEECWTWQDNNPVCSLDESTLCDDPDSELVNHGVMSACEGNCKECWRWKEHIDDMKQEQQEDAE